MKFPQAAHLVSPEDADKIIVTLKRVEIAGHIAFVKEGEKPRIRVKASRG